MHEILYELIIQHHNNHRICSCAPQRPSSFVKAALQWYSGIGGCRVLRLPAHNRGLRLRPIGVDLGSLPARFLAAVKGHPISGVSPSWCTHCTIMVTPVLRLLPLHLCHC